MIGAHRLRAKTSGKKLYFSFAPETMREHRKNFDDMDDIR
jgi:hypothetical protein